MPTLGTRAGVTHRVNQPAVDAAAPTQADSPTSSPPPMDRVEVAPPTAEANDAAPSARRTIGQRLGSLARGTLKGAAVIGVAAGLVVGGMYIGQHGGLPNPLQSIESPTIPGGVHDPSLPGGQSPPKPVDPGSGVHRSPTLPALDLDDTPSDDTRPSTRIPAPGTTLPTFDPGEVVRDPIPADGGQRPSDIPRLRRTTPPSDIQSPVRGIPGVGQSGDTPDAPTRTLPTFDPTEVEKPPIETRRPLPHQGPGIGTTDPLKPSTPSTSGATTDPEKPAPSPSGVSPTLLPSTPAPQTIDSTRLPTFRPHTLPR